jgi:hypothetical protein
MKYINIVFYEDNEHPFINNNNFVYEYTHIDDTLYFKIINPFIWKNKIITGFFKGHNGIGWTNGILQLNQKKNFPVSDKQLIEFEKVIKEYKNMI